MNAKSTQPARDTGHENYFIGGLIW